MFIKGNVTKEENLVLITFSHRDIIIQFTVYDLNNVIIIMLVNTYLNCVYSAMLGGAIPDYSLQCMVV